MIYLDNAATSWPKPPEVFKAMIDVLAHSGGNPGRSGHRLSIAAARVMYEARETISSFFNLNDPMRVIFTNNATHSLNIVIHGILKPGDTAIVSSIEHNAVMRPLRFLKNQGVHLKIVNCDINSKFDIDNFIKAINTKTKLVVMVHGSNVTGTILPMVEIAKITHKAGALLLVDAAQTAGVVPIDINMIDADFIAITGHKGPQGPTGIGVLLINPKYDISLLPPFTQGGTGSRSAAEEQPNFLPDKYEAGTANLAGIAGIVAGIQWVKKHGINNIHAHETDLIKMLVEGLSVIQGVKIYGTLDINNSAPIISFKANNKTVSEIGLKLDEDYGILTRVGLHCAPAAHHTIGSFPDGTVRLAPGALTNKNDIQKTLIAIQKVLRS